MTTSVLRASPPSTAAEAAAATSRWRRGRRFFGGMMGGLFGAGKVPRLRYPPRTIGRPGRPPFPRTRQRSRSAKRSRQRRGTDNKMARCDPTKTTAHKKTKVSEARRALFHSPKKTKRVSGVSHGHTGARRHLGSDIDRRGHDCGGNPVVDAGHGGRHPVSSARRARPTTPFWLIDRLTGSV